MYYYCTFPLTVGGTSVYVAAFLVLSWKNGVEDFESTSTQKLPGDKGNQAVLKKTDNMHPKNTTGGARPDISWLECLTKILQA